FFSRDSCRRVILFPVTQVILFSSYAGFHIRYQRVGAAPGGAKLRVTGRHLDLPWLRVEGDFGVGWVRILYTIFRGDWDTVPVVDMPVGEIELPVGVVSIVRPIYAQPYGIGQVGELMPDTYTIVGRTQDFAWVQLSTPSGVVWINVYHITLRGVSDNIPVVQ
ncbi:MAG: hypothetical protein JW966_09510, partial [Anaerolineae bacterium]|nr:hypothetical protein [Anaerolineae bacterium]